MRTTVVVLTALALGCLLIAQSPITIGGDHTSGYFGIAKILDWYNATASGCTAGTGYCVGHTPEGDTYFWTGWMPNASGLPITGGLPIVGTINDYTLASPGPGLTGNIAIMQLDTFNWSTPNASHVQVVNGMQSYGTSSGSHNQPAGWFGALTSGDGITLGTWKNRAIFSIGGILYLPVERQYSPGDPSVHDATYIMSPDSGAHWCNPYTYWSHTTTPGCDSSNWSATGDAPSCGAAASSSDPCTDASYTDSSHSSILFKAFPLGDETFLWLNHGVQDGQTLPTTPDGCSPATYVCFISTLGYLARVNLVGTITGQPDATDIMDRSKWKFYTCPTITSSYRCPSSDSSNWTSTFASATSVRFSSYYLGPFYNSMTTLSGLMYVAAYNSYLMTGWTDAFGPTSSIDFLWAPRPEGPWSTSVKTSSPQPPSFFTPSPALGYTTSGTHVQITGNSNNYPMGGAGSQIISLWDFNLGRTENGEQLRCTNYPLYVSGACYQFSPALSTGPHGSMPSKGLVYSFDFLDVGAGTAITNLPFFASRTNPGAVLRPCEGLGGTTCGSMNAGHGTSMNGYGAVVAEGGFVANFHSFADWNGAAQNAPAMAGNGTYSVVSVVRYDGSASSGKYSGIWSTGTATSSDNTGVQFAIVSSGQSVLMWNGDNKPFIQFVPSFVFTAGDWVFTAITVQASVSSACPVVSIWIGQSGAVSDLAGSCSGAFGSTSNVPAVTAAPFYVGVSVDGWSMPATHATTLLYNRALSAFEVRQMYTAMKSKMSARGISLQ